MKKTEATGFIIGLLISITFWVGIFCYSIYQLISRILYGGDIFPPLTVILIMSIIVKLNKINQSFNQIVEWIKK